MRFQFVTKVEDKWIWSCHIYCISEHSNWRLPGGIY
jgi:hypothetical protein